MLRQDVNRVGWRTIVAIEELDIPIPRGAAERIARQFVPGRYAVEHLQEVGQTRAVRLAGAARQQRHIKVIGRAVIGRGLARGCPYAAVLRRVALHCGLQFTRNGVDLRGRERLLFFSAAREEENKGKRTNCGQPKAEGPLRQFRNSGSREKGIRPGRQTATLPCAPGPSEARWPCAGRGLPAKAAGAQQFREALRQRRCHPRNRLGRRWLDALPLWAARPLPGWTSPPPYNSSPPSG